MRHESMLSAMWPQLSQFCSDQKVTVYTVPLLSSTARILNCPSAMLAVVVSLVIVLRIVLVVVPPLELVEEAPPVMVPLVQRRWWYH